MHCDGTLKYASCNDTFARGTEWEQVFIMRAPALCLSASKCFGSFASCTIVYIFQDNFLIKTTAKSGFLKRLQDHYCRGAQLLPLICITSFQIFCYARKRLQFEMDFHARGQTIVRWHATTWSLRHKTFVLVTTVCKKSTVLPMFSRIKFLGYHHPLWKSLLVFAQVMIVFVACVRNALMLCTYSSFH